MSAEKNQIEALEDVSSSANDDAQLATFDGLSP